VWNEIEYGKSVVLEDGAVVEQGAHQILMETQWLYRRMWDEQQKVRQWKT
jgi:ATP-binding cassette subfamily B protein